MQNKIRYLFSFFVIYSSILFAATDFSSIPFQKEKSASYNNVGISHLKQVLAKSYNFKGNDKEAQEFLSRQTLRFYRGLRENCRPGEYIFNHAVTIVQAKMAGLQNEVCIVNLTREFKGKILKEHCEIERVNLLLFTDDAANIMSAFTHEKRKKLHATPEGSQRVKQTTDAILANFERYCRVR